MVEVLVVGKEVEKVVGVEAVEVEEVVEVVEVVVGRRRKGCGGDLLRGWG